MRKFIALFILIIPAVAPAQKDLFMAEFNEVNNWFFNQPEIVLVQKYIYYKDSSMIYPADSSVCTIIKNNTAIHYRIAGLESFSDNGYMVKISHTEKFMIVSKIEKTDTAQLRTLFSEGFSGFNTFVKTIPEKNCSRWELGGGTAGVNSARLVLDTKNHKIKFLEIYMASSHPLVSPFRKPGQETDPTVIIKVDYYYLGKIKKEEVETLNDFITINEGRITASAKYKEYRVKLLTEKQ